MAHKFPMDSDAVRTVSDKLSRDEKPEFHEVYRAWGRKVFNYFRSLAYNEELAEDLTQDVFVKWQRLYEGMDPEKDVEQWMSYCMKTANSVWANHYRRQPEKLDASLDFEDENGLSLEETLDSDFGQHSNEGELWMANEQVIGDVLRALEDENPEWRRIFELREIEGYSLKEVSEEVGVPLGTVKSRIHRVKSRVRRVLRENPYFRDYYEEFLEDAA